MLPGVWTRRGSRISAALEALREREAPELEQVAGLRGEHAWRLLASIELGRRVHRAQLLPGDSLCSASAAARHVRDGLCAPGREEFHALLLDTKHRVIGTRLISIGSLQSSLVHPREVFRPAIALSAAALLVAHNHPSGDPWPSSEDEAVTERLREAGELLGIRLLDHLVLGAQRFYSFAEGRKLDFEGES
jgi:DNA repair protein RadC